jgi:hypothetical protein
MFVSVCKHLGGVAVKSRVMLSVSNIFWVAEGSSARSALSSMASIRTGMPGPEAAMTLLMVSMHYGTNVEEVASDNYIDSVFQKFL